MRISSSRIVVLRLDKPESGREQYEQDHIEGAVYVDLEKDLSGAKWRTAGDIRSRISELSLSSLATSVSMVRRPSLLTTIKAEPWHRACGGC